jgi:glycosyltransferase involved in cell wall biosynthesis
MKNKLFKFYILLYHQISKIFLIVFLSSKFIMQYEDINFKQNKNEINLLTNYYKINSKGILINKKIFTKKEDPKVSIITAVYNREDFIIRFLRSIQNQYFDDIEMIFIDDNSDDNSRKIIEKYKKEDERIILIRNKKNKGTLISRNIGALKSKGKYLIFPDPDDILSSDILKNCYETSKQYNLDLIRFNIYSDKYFIFSQIDRKLKRRIYQPELRTYLIYGYGYQRLVDGILSNKFVKKTTFIITLNEINNYYLNQKMIYFEDGLINYSLHLNAKSLYLLNHIGYYYIFNKKSVSRSLNFDSYFKCFFIFLKFLFEKTKNNKYEKEMNFYVLKEYIKENDIIKNISKFSKLYEEVINDLLNIKFINCNNKKKLNELKSIILHLKKTSLSIL